MGFMGIYVFFLSIQGKASVSAHVATVPQIYVKKNTELVFSRNGAPTPRSCKNPLYISGSSRIYYYYYYFRHL